jgi:hypothetical protein
MSRFGEKYSYFRFQVLSGESQEQFDALLAEYHSAYAPSGVHESFLVGDMARAHWTILRMRRVTEFGPLEPKARDLATRKIAASKRTVRRAHRLLLDGRRVNGSREKDTPARLSLRTAAMQGRLPDNITAGPTLEVLFGNDDPFASRA